MAKKPHRALSKLLTENESLVRAERKQEEENLRRMATVVRDSNDAITIQDFEGGITAWNRGATLMYGYSEEEALRSNINLLTTPDKVGEQKAFIRRLVAGEAVTSFETQRVTKDGRVLDVWMTVTKLMDDAGKPIGLASTERDITAQKQNVAEVHSLNVELEQRVALRTAQLEATNKELEAFAYSVSHDLLAPVRAIDGFSKALLEDYHDKLDDTGRDYLNRVRAGTQRMGRLIDDLLKLSRLTRAEMHHQRLDLGELVTKIAAELQRDEPDRRIDFDVSPGLTAHGDRTLLETALENLLRNAWKFTGHRDRARIELGVTDQNGERVYYVRDDGAGFDMAFAGKLFGAFQRLHDASDFPGNGIGLAIVKRVILCHGGRIWAEAEVDKGATFFITLPTVASASDDNRTETVT